MPGYVCIRSAMAMFRKEVTLSNRMQQVLLLTLLIYVASQPRQVRSEEYWRDVEHDSQIPVDAEGETHPRMLRRSAQSSETIHPCRNNCRRGNQPVNASTQELLKRYRTDTIKGEILRKLRMDAPPNVTTGNRELNTMRRFLNNTPVDNSYRPIYGQENEGDYSTPITIIVQSQRVPHTRLNTPSSCFFNLTSDTFRENQPSLLSAQLGVYVRRRSSNFNTNGVIAIRVVIKKYTRINRNNGFAYLTEKYHNKKIRADHLGRWHYFDIKSLVEVWLAEPAKNLGITISMVFTPDNNAEQLAVVQPRSPSEETQRPFVEVKMRPSSSRVTRSIALDCDEGSREARCCRYPLNIDFETFKWDWIIAPKNYDAYYCSGECSILYQQPNIQAHLKTQMSNPALGSPCCAPTQVSPLPLIYMDDKMKGIVYGSIPGMIVDKCGCL